jgi:LysR family nitrogen assimilation transcriptional regulator
MDLKDLKYFVAVYEARGFSRASDALGTVQSNVSTRVKQLERLLGVLLFERRYRDVVPTAKGEQLYNRAKELIAAAAKTEESIRLESDAGIRETEAKANAA